MSQQILNVGINMFNKCKNYLENVDVIVFILITIIVLYFLMYLISFFFKLPVIILFGILIGYYIYYKKIDLKNMKII